MSNLIPVEELKNSDFKEILCYPKFTDLEFEKRLKELKNLDIVSFEVGGEKKVGKFSVLGKGHASIVVKVTGTNGKHYALKIRRVDATKPDLTHESEILKKVNRVGVGAKIFKATKNFILLELVEDEPLPRWIENLKNKNGKTRLENVLKQILTQCFMLDMIGIDHGELSRATKHVLVSKTDKPYLVDFGKASNKRKISNLTSICQYLFIRGGLPKKIEAILGKVDKQKLVEDLKVYKRKPCERNFQKILETLKL